MVEHLVANEDMRVRFPLPAPINCPFRILYMDSFKEIKILFTKLFKHVSIWGSESILKSSLILAIIFIVGIPFIQGSQNLVKKLPYLEILNKFFTFLLSTAIKDYFIALFFLISFLLIYELYLKYRGTQEVKDNFKRGLSKWAIPQNSGWTIQKSIDYSKLGKMLSVTNSGFPGILKDAYTWYDYEMQFKALIPKDINHDKQNFTFVVRAEDNYNGVMFQVTKTHINPHLIYDSTFIRDIESNLPLPTILKTNSWISVKVRVNGDQVDIFIDDFKVGYRISSNILNFVRKDLLSMTADLSDLKKSNAEMESALDDLSTAQKIEDDSRREFEVKQAREKLDSYIRAAGPAGFTKVILEYQKGTVGFRESGTEKSYIKDFRLKKI